MAYYDWRAFMPDPRRPRIGQVLSGIADTLYQNYELGRRTELNRDFRRGLESEIQRCVQDPNCDQAALLRNSRLHALAGGFDDIADDLGSMAAQQQEAQEDAAVADRALFSHIRDPEVRQAVKDYRDEHGTMPDSGMMRDITAAVERDQAVRDAATKEFLAQRVEKDPPKTKADALDRCIDNQILDRGGDPNDPSADYMPDLITCENQFETGRRSHREELDALYADKPAGTTAAGKTGDAPIEASPDGVPAVTDASLHSKAMRAKLADAITAQEVGSWEAGYGLSNEVNNAFQGFAAAQKRQGNDYYWNIRPPTPDQLRVLRPIINRARDPFAGVNTADEHPDDVPALVAQQRERDQGSYLAMRSGLSVEQRHNLDALLGVDRRQRVNVDPKGNVNNRTANRDAAANHTPDGAFTVSPVNRANTALAKLAGQEPDDDEDSIVVDPNVSHADEFGTPETASAGYVAPWQPGIAAPPPEPLTPFMQQQFPPGSPANTVNVVDRALREAGL